METTKTPMQKLKSIMNELRKLKYELKLKKHCNPTNEAQMRINKKYGKGWRESLTLEDMKLNPQNYKFKNYESYSDFH